jgi:hypothetical protein
MRHKIHRKSRKRQPLPRQEEIVWVILLINKKLFYNTKQNKKKKLIFCVKSFIHNFLLVLTNKNKNKIKKYKLVLATFIKTEISGAQKFFLVTNRLIKFVSR